MTDNLEVLLTRAAVGELMDAAVEAFVNDRYREGAQIAIEIAHRCKQAVDKASPDRMNQLYHKAMRAVEQETIKQKGLLAVPPYMMHPESRRIRNACRQEHERRKKAVRVH